MGFNAEEYLPPPRPRKAKKPKQGRPSGEGSGHQVGMAIAIFGSAGAVLVTVVAYLVHGYLA